MEKSAEAYRTIGEVAAALKLPQHVLRFWETRFPQVKPLKRGGGRRFYRPADVELLRAIRNLLYDEGYTIKGVQRILQDQGPRAVASLAEQGRQAAPRSRETPAAVATAETDAPPPAPSDPLPGRIADHGPGTPSSGAPRPAPAGSGDPPVRTGDGATDLAGLLRGALAELSECERLLAAASR